MKIIYCSDAVIPDRPAHTVHIMKMCQALAKNGHKVTLLAHECKNLVVKTDDEFAYYGVERCFDIVRLPCPAKSAGALIYAYKALRYIKKHKPDVVYGRSLYICSLVARFTSIPVVYESHNSIENHGKAGFFFRNLIKGKSFDHLVTISAPLAAYYQREWGIDSDKIVTAHDGADVPDYNKKHDVEIEHGEKGRNVGYIGHLYEGRGIDVICKAAELCPDYMFHIVGGNESDVAKWKEKACKNSNIIFYGYVSPSTVHSYGLQFDILLAPYQRKVLCGTNGARSETSSWMSPLKVFEYMSYGKPILCSDLPALHEILKDEETCLFCTPDSPEDWTAAIKRISEDSILAEKIGSRAKQEFLEKYTWRGRASQVLCR